jgi:hypothetical protein
VEITVEFCKKLKIEPLYDPAIPFLGIFLKNQKPDTIETPVCPCL